MFKSSTNNYVTSVLIPYSRQFRLIIWHRQRMSGIYLYKIICIPNTQVHDGLIDIHVFTAKTHTHNTGFLSLIVRIRSTPCPHLIYILENDAWKTDRISNFRRRSGNIAAEKSTCGCRSRDQSERCRPGSLLVSRDLFLFSWPRGSAHKTINLVENLQEEPDQTTPNMIRLLAERDDGWTHLSGQLVHTPNL